MIPTTVEEQWRPYIKNANYSDTFSSYFKGKRERVDLGTYIVTFIYEVTGVIFSSNPILS